VTHAYAEMHAMVVRARKLFEDQDPKVDTAAQVWLRDAEILLARSPEPSRLPTDWI